MSFPCTCTRTQIGPETSLFNMAIARFYSFNRSTFSNRVVLYVQLAYTHKLLSHTLAAVVEFQYRSSPKHRQQLATCLSIMFFPGRTECRDIFKLFAAFIIYVYFICSSKILRFCLFEFYVISRVLVC